MMKLVDIRDLKSLACDGRIGSSPIASTKQCSKCKIIKNLNEFNYKNKKIESRHSLCKPCFKIYSIDYYKNNKPVYAKARSKLQARGYKSDKQLTDYINSFKSGGCVLCGETFFGALDFHHINPSIKEDAVARLTSKKSVKNEVEKCVVLCSNCHRKFHCGHAETIIKLNEVLVQIQPGTPD